MNHNPSIPTIQFLPLNLAIDCAVGFSYAKIARVNLHLTMVICAVRCLSNTLLFVIVNEIANLASPNRDRALGAHKVFFYTSTLTNAIFIVALRELNLIGRLTTAILVIGASIQIFTRLTYIESQQNTTAIPPQFPPASENMLPFSSSS